MNNAIGTTNFLGSGDNLIWIIILIVLFNPSILNCFCGNDSWMIIIVLLLLCCQNNRNMC